MKNYKKWSTEEDEFIKKFYPENGPAYCAEKLQINNKRNVFRRATQLGVKMNSDFKNQHSLKYTKKVLEEAVKNSLCYADVCRFVGITPQAGNFGNIRRRIEQHQISTEHFLTPGELNSLRKSMSLNEKAHNNGQFIQKPILDFLVINSVKIDSSKLKIRLYNEGLKKNNCEKCGQGEMWMGEKISLILDHQNGIHNDNRLENLRILCPNCNAALPTHCSKNRKNTKPILNKELNKKETNKPQLNLLLNDLKQLGSYVQVGKKYNVSDNAIRKWLKSYGIDPPKRLNKKKINKNGKFEQCEY